MIRSTCGILMAALVCLCLQASISAQPVLQPELPAKLPTTMPSRPQFSTLVGLPTDRDQERKLEAIRDYIQTGDFREVTQALQDILDHPQDCFVPVARESSGQKTVAWVSARVEANRLLGSLPAKGRQVYEVLSGGKAGAMLKEARASGRERLAEVVRRYLHTTAGTEAAELLGMDFLDRGRYLMAAVCFNQLLEKSELPGMTLFKAAVAMQRYGDAAGVQRAWHRLEKQFPDGLAIGERRLTLAELKKMLEQPANAKPPAAAADWLMFRGDGSRSASLNEFQPVGQLTSAWKMPMALETTTRSWIDSASDGISSRGQAVMPGFFPLAHAGKAIFRSHGYIQAVDLATGELAWKSQMNGSFDFPVQLAPPSANIHAKLSGWVDAYLQQSPSMLVENSVQGMLSSDGTRVFAIEDVAVPPYQMNPYYGNAIVFRGGRFGAEPKTAEFRQNQLLCLELDSGRVAWAVGLENDGPLHEAIFLGPPLPLDGKLYALVEKDLELRLCCLAPRDGKLLWSQPLAQTKKTIHDEVGRRVWAVPIAHSEGILVCPTHSGAVVAFDLLKRSLLWAHAYAQAPPLPQPQKVMVGGKVRLIAMRPGYVPRLTANWKNAGPVITDGKVLITAPDANEVHCLNLRDGGLLWKMPWTADDQCLDAGIGKVLIVGKQSCRAVDLASGRPLWTTPTGMPSGQGLLAVGHYLLPLREGAVVALDIRTGQPGRRFALPGNERPGNLLIHRGRLVSQSATSFSVFAPGK